MHSPHTSKVSQRQTEYLAHNSPSCALVSFHVGCKLDFLPWSPHTLFTPLPCHHTYPQYPSFKPPPSLSAPPIQAPTSSAHSSNTPQLCIHNQHPTTPPPPPFIPSLVSSILSPAPLVHAPLLHPSHPHPAPTSNTPRSPTRHPHPSLMPPSQAHHAPVQ